MKTRNTALDSRVWRSGSYSIIMEHTAVFKKNSKIYIQIMKTWNQYLHIAFFSLSIVWCGIKKYLKQIFFENFWLGL